MPDEVIINVPNRQVAEQIEKVFIGVETNLRYGIDIPIPEPIFIYGSIIVPHHYDQIDSLYLDTDTIGGE